MEPMLPLWEGMERREVCVDFDWDVYFDGWDRGWADLCFVGECRN